MENSFDKLNMEAKKESENFEEKRIVSCEEVFQMKEKENPYLIKGLVPEEAITMISSDTGTGKSLTTLLFAKSVATGIKLFDEFETKQGRVLIVDLEMNQNDIISRNRRVVQEVVKDLDYLFCQDFKLDNPTDFQWLEAMIKQNGYKFVIFDAFSSVHNSNENDTQQMGMLNTLMLKLTRQSKITLLYTQHNARPYNGSKGRERGSTDLPAKVASQLDITRTKGITAKGEDKNIIIVWQKKVRDVLDIGKIRFDFWLDKETDRTKWEYKGRIDTEKMAVDNVKEDILDLLKENEELTIKETTELLTTAGKKHGLDTIRKAVKKMFEIGTLTKFEGKQGRQDKRANEISFSLAENDENT